MLLQQKYNLHLPEYFTFCKAACHRLCSQAIHQPLHLALQEMCLSASSLTVNMHSILLVHNFSPLKCTQELINEILVYYGIAWALIWVDMLWNILGTYSDVLVGASCFSYAMEALTSVCRLFPDMAELYSCVIFWKYIWVCFCMLMVVLSFSEPCTSLCCGTVVNCSHDPCPLPTSLH